MGVSETSVFNQHENNSIYFFCLCFSVRIVSLYRQPTFLTLKKKTGTNISSCVCNSGLLWDRVETKEGTHSWSIKPDHRKCHVFPSSVKLFYWVIPLPIVLGTFSMLWQKHPTEATGGRAEFLCLTVWGFHPRWPGRQGGCDVTSTVKKQGTLNAHFQFPSCIQVTTIATHIQGRSFSPVKPFRKCPHIDTPRSAVLWLF